MRNENEHNPQQRPLRRWLGNMPENRRFLAAYVRTRDVLNVLTLVLPPAVQKTACFHGCVRTYYVRRTSSQSTNSRNPENRKHRSNPWYRTVQYRTVILGTVQAKSQRVRKHTLLCTTIPDPEFLIKNTAKILLKTTYLRYVVFSNILAVFFYTSGLI